MSAECICEVLPEKYHYVYNGTTEPGSMWDWNPDCPVHPGDPLVGTTAGDGEASTANIVDRYPTEADFWADDEVTR